MIGALLLVVAQVAAAPASPEAPPNQPRRPSCSGSGRCPRSRGALGGRRIRLDLATLYDFAHPHHSAGDPPPSRSSILLRRRRRRRPFFRVAGPVYLGGIVD